jgi:membrane protein
LNPRTSKRGLVVKEWLERLKAKPWVAHLLRAVERFASRLGDQFGAAITYFSVLALIPVLLFAFAVLGFVLTVLRPDLINNIVDAFAGAVGTVDLAAKQQLVGLVSDTLGNWRGVGIVALLSAIYSGAGWMDSLKKGVRAQWRRNFNVAENQGNIIKWTLVNLVTLVGMIVLIAVTFALASISTALADDLVRLIGLDQIGWLSPVLRIVPIIFSVGAGWLLFMYLFTVLPEEREPWPVVRRGALIGAIGLGVLQYSTGLLFNLFGQNRAASIFGPVIVLMLFFNIFAQLILFVAAWIATTSQEAVPATEEKVRFPLTPAGEQPDEEGGGTGDGSKPVMVPQPVAVRSVQVGLGAGYVTGAATGVGLGAGLAWLLSKAVRGRR